MQTEIGQLKQQISNAQSKIKQTQDTIKQQKELIQQAKTLTSQAQALCNDVSSIRERLVESGALLPEEEQKSSESMQIVSRVVDEEIQPNQEESKATEPEAQSTSTTQAEHQIVESVVNFAQQIMQGQNQPASRQASLESELLTTIMNSGLLDQESHRQTKKYESDSNS